MKTNFPFARTFEIRLLSLLILSIPFCLTIAHIFAIDGNAMKDSAFPGCSMFSSVKILGP